MIQFKKTKQVLVAAAVVCAVLALTVAIQSCSSSSDDDPAPVKSIYVAGDLIGTDGLQHACFWKDGHIDTLSKTNNFSTALAITVSGTDIYIVGYEQIGGSSVARLWKKNAQGIQTVEFANDDKSEAISVAVSGTSIFISGFGSADGGVYVAKYWKITGQTVVETALSTEGHPARAYSITVSGTDVYVAGYEENNDGVSVATYWKNNHAGAVVLNEDASVITMANSITVSGNDVYVGGFETNADGVDIAKYWKNNQAGAVSLSTGPLSNLATSIAVSGTDVYVAGYALDPADGNVSAAKYWKKEQSGNAVETALAGGTDYYANSIFVLGTDVYIAGYDVSNDSPQTAKYWKNNKDVILSTTGATANSIFVH